MQVQVNSTSISKNHQRAQVTVLIGEGRNRRSVTRHVEQHPIGKKSFGWFGFNPDPNAVPLNELYEDELIIAKSNLASAEAVLADLEKKLEKVEGVEKSQMALDNILGDIAVAVVKNELLGAIETAQDTVYASTALVDEAETKLDIVQREVPLEVEFVGPGLTY